MAWLHMAYNTDNTCHHAIQGFENCTEQRKEQLWALKLDQRFNEVGRIPFSF